MGQTTEEKHIRVTSHGGQKGSIQIEGFDGKELDKMIAAMKHGTYYVKVKDGKFTAIPTLQELPGPIEDEEMLPFWRKHQEQTIPLLYEEYHHSKEKGRSASISIQSLCGYNYSKERYKEEAKRLESYGFECLRSRRGPDGMYWEIWFLPGLWSAKGHLEVEIKRAQNDDDKLRIALEFLRHNVQFGTLDASIQRLAMANPE